MSHLPSDNAWIYIDLKESPGGNMAQIRGRGLALATVHESLDDARLIAAAPELLEALEEMVRDCDRPVDTCARCEKASAAIAKARGTK